MTKPYTIAGIMAGWIALALALGVLSPMLTFAQPTRIARIGVLSAGPATPPAAPLSPLREALLRGLRELGWVEGQNIAFEYRYAAWQLERIATDPSARLRAEIDSLRDTPTRAMPLPEKSSR
mgnify:CR=1 FL=1